jgi:hypothetical protein
MGLSLLTGQASKKNEGVVAGMSCFMNDSNTCLGCRLGLAHMAYAVLTQVLGVFICGHSRSRRERSPVDEG